MAPEWMDGVMRVGTATSRDGSASPVSAQCAASTRTLTRALCRLLLPLFLSENLLLPRQLPRQQGAHCRPVQWCRH